VSAATAAATIEARFVLGLGDFRLDAALECPASGVTALIGPSGSGKTTLLRCIAGLTRAPGRLLVRGRVWQDESRFLPPHQRPVGYVFQEASLLPHLTVRGNLDYGYRRARPPRRIGFDDVVALIGLAGLLERMPAKLSGGERQRVAIARALLRQPEILLMDEPLAGLDAAARAEITPYLAGLRSAMALPMIYVTHDLVEAARLADRVMVMRAGRIVAPPRAAGGADEAEARASLAAMDNDRITRLALAALRAGLAPADDGEVSPPPG
jgi:molybdate transport system ATP-binding protein